MLPRAAQNTTRLPIVGIIAQDLDAIGPRRCVDKYVVDKREQAWNVQCRAAQQALSMFQGCTSEHGACR